MGQQLAKGVDTFEAGSWSGAGFGAAAELEVSVEFQRIVAGLTQSASSIKSLDFNATSKGIVGGPDDGPLILNANNDADSRVRNCGWVDLFVKAATKVENIHTGHVKARTRMLGGLFETCSISAGRLTATSDTIVDEFYGLGGDSRLPYCTTTMSYAKYAQGTHFLGRKASLIIVGEGVVLDLDPDAAVDWAASEILIVGGRVNWWGGAIPTITALGGVLDFRYARGPITGLGTTSFELVGTTVYDNPYVSLSNAVTPPAILRTSGGAVQFPGGFTPSPS